MRLTTNLTKVHVPRLMESAGGEMKEVFCGSYTTFAITSGFNNFPGCYDFSLFAPGGDLLSVGKGKGGRLGRTTAEDRATVLNLLIFLFQCWAQVGKVEVGEPVVGGAAGPSHAVALTETGKVWQWGGARWRLPDYLQPAHHQLTLGQLAGRKTCGSQSRWRILMEWWQWQQGATIASH